MCALPSAVQKRALKQIQNQLIHSQTLSFQTAVEQFNIEAQLKIVSDFGF